ncbi:MAG: hypothetical protein ACJAXJ_001199 [Colwellia sp.]|jgi:hypothetical protein
MKFMLFIALLCGVNYIPTASAVDYGTKATDSKFQKADVVIVQMNDIRASVYTFYDDNAALPANMGLLVNPVLVYYTGNIRSALGTSFIGAISADGRFFNVTVDLKSTEVAAYVAQRINTQPVGTLVTLSIGTPASSIVDNGFVARNLDPARPELNQMNTDLGLGGNDINDVDVINATRLNISDLATVDSLQVITNTTTLDLVSTRTSTLKDVNISGVTTLNTASINGSLVINGAVDVNSIASFNNEANFNAAVNVSGLLSVLNGMDVVNGLKVRNGLDVDSIDADTAAIDQLTTTDVTATGTATLQNVVTQNIIATEAVINGNITSNSGTVIGDQTVQGTAYNNALDVTGLSVLRGGLNVLGETNLGDVSIDGNTVVNGEITAALGLFLGDASTYIGKSGLNDSVRFRNTTGWVDVGQDVSGVVNFQTDGNGYTFDHKVKAMGTGGDIELNVSGGYPEIVFSRLGRDVTFGLTGASTMSLAGADLKTTNRIYAKELFENNVSLKNVYLGINDKAKDSDKLDGLSSEAFARVEHKHNKLEGAGWQNVNLNTIANTVASGTLQMDQYLNGSVGQPSTSDNANAVLTVGQHGGGYSAQLAFSSDGSMYHRDNPSNTIGSWGKVWTANNDGAGSGLDAGKLGGKNPSEYLLKNDPGVMQISNRATGIGGTTYNGMRVANNDGDWIRSTKNGILPWQPNQSYIGTSSWNFYAIYSKTLYEGNVSLASKYLGRGATAVNSNKLGGYSASSFYLKNNNIIVSKANSWLSLDSPSSGSGYNQSAGISIGESGSKGRNAVHLTYNGSGASYLGMGSVNGITNKPTNAVLQMNVGSNNALFLGDIYEKGQKLEDKYMQKGSGGWTLIWSGSENSNVYLPSDRRIEGKEVTFVGSDTHNSHELTYMKTFIPVNGNFHKPYFRYGDITYYYDNRHLKYGGDAGFRKIWSRTPVDIPPIGTINK